MRHRATARIRSELGMARVDFIAAQDSTAAALEVNPTPGISAGSNIVTGAGLLGLGHADILREALARPRYDAPLPVPDFSGRPYVT